LKVKPSIQGEIKKKIKQMADEFYEEIDKKTTTKCIALP